MYTIKQLIRESIAIRCQNQEQAIKLLREAGITWVVKSAKDYNLNDFQIMISKTGYSWQDNCKEGFEKYFENKGHADITIDFSEIDFGTNLNEFSIWN